MMHITYKLYGDKVVIATSNAEETELYIIPITNSLSIERQVKNYVEEELDQQISTIKHTY